MKVIDYRTYEKPSHYIKFRVGPNRFRIVSKGYMGYEHGTKVSGKYTYLGRCSQNLSCEHCRRGNDPKLKYKWIIYTTEVNGLGVRLLSCGPRIGDKLCKMAKLESTSTFDVIVNREGTGLNSKYEVDRANLTRIDTKLMPLIEQARDYLLRKYVL